MKNLGQLNDACKYLVEFAAEFGYDADKILSDKFIKLYPRRLRPYGRLYAY
jgi:hypothetical protein